MKKRISSGSGDSRPHGGIGEVAVLDDFERAHHGAVTEQAADRAGLAPPPTESPKTTVVIVESSSPLLAARILKACSDPLVETQRTGVDTCQIENGYRRTKEHLADPSTGPLVDDAQIAEGFGEGPDQGRGGIPDRTIGAPTQRWKVMVEAGVGQGAIMTPSIPGTMSRVVEAYESASRLQLEKLGTRRQDRRRSWQGQGM